MRTPDQSWFATFGRAARAFALPPFVILIGACGGGRTGSDAVGASGRATALAAGADVAGLHLPYDIYLPGTLTQWSQQAANKFPRNFKLLGEVSVDRVKPDGAPARNLTKMTFAPTLSTGQSFWARPELRLYVTHAKWNQAANVAAGAGGLAGLGDNRTTGTSVGLQAEIWW